MRKKYVTEFITRVILFFVTVSIYFYDKKYLEFQGMNLLQNRYLIFLWIFLMLDMVKRLKPNSRICLYYFLSDGNIDTVFIKKDFLNTLMKP